LIQTRGVEETTRTLASGWKAWVQLKLRGSPIIKEKGSPDGRRKGKLRLGQGGGQKPKHRGVERLPGVLRGGRLVSTKHGGCKFVVGGNTSLDVHPRNGGNAKNKPKKVALQGQGRTRKRAKYPQIHQTGQKASDVTVGFWCQTGNELKLIHWVPKTLGDQGRGKGKTSGVFCARFRSRPAPGGTVRRGSFKENAKSRGKKEKTFD